LPVGLCTRAPDYAVNAEANTKAAVPKASGTQARLAALWTSSDEGRLPAPGTAVVVAPATVGDGRAITLTPPNAVVFTPFASKRCMRIAVTLAGLALPMLLTTASARSELLEGQLIV